MEKKITIGGSEIAVVMGLSRWKTPLRLWAEKTGKFETEDISGREYVQLGTELEDFVAQKFARETGVKVRRDSKTFTYKKYPYMIGHIDRRIVGTDELLECKTCDARKIKEWEGEEIPVEYVLQVMWYLGVTGMSKGHIAVLIGGNKFRTKEVDFDEELFEKQVEAAREFVETFCANDIPPMAIAGDSSTLMRMYPQSGEHIITSEDGDVDELIGDLQFIKSQIAEFDKAKEDHEARIKQMIGDAQGLDALTWGVTWKTQGNTRLDYDRMKEDGVYDKYAIKKDIRVLRIKKKKEKTL